MQTPTITCPAELQTTFSRRTSRRERLAAERLKETYRKLLSEANCIHQNMQTAENQFNYLSNEKEIDACIYRLRTAQCQYISALTRLKHLQTRMENLTCDS